MADAITFPGTIRHRPDASLPGTQVRTPGSEMLEAARELNLPVPACDALPPALTDVLICDGSAWHLGWIDDDGRWWLNHIIPCPDDFVTHWQPLPALPHNHS